MSRYYILTYFSVASMILLSCASTKEIRKQTELIRRPEALIDASAARNVDFKQSSIKASIVVSSETVKNSFKATIKMDRDSTIWATVTLFGIAGAKILMTNDSVKYINYKDKNYMLEEYSAVQDFLKTNLLTIQNLQDVLLGELPKLDEFEKLKLKLEDEKYHLSTMSERKIESDWVEKKMGKFERKIEKQEEQNDERGLERMERKQEKNEEKYENMALDFWVEPISLKLERIRIKDYVYDAELNILYSEFQEVSPGNNLPHKLSIVVREKKTINIEISYSKVIFEEGQEMPFSIPNSYQRVKM